LHEQDDIFQRNQCIIIILFEIKAIASDPILVVLGLINAVYSLHSISRQNNSDVSLRSHHFFRDLDSGSGFIGSEEMVIILPGSSINEVVAVPFFILLSSTDFFTAK
jgi:hypothetical protein